MQRAGSERWKRPPERKRIENYRDVLRVRVKPFPRNDNGFNNNKDKMARWKGRFTRCSGGLHRSGPLPWRRGTCVAVTCRATCESTSNSSVRDVRSSPSAFSHLADTSAASFVFPAVSCDPERRTPRGVKQAGGCGRVPARSERDISGVRELR